MADPPGQYGKRRGDPSQRGAAPCPSLGLEDVKALPVGGPVARDAVLWLWTTNAHLPDAFEVVRA
jgi:N6-adenosine-specific RNA methylase IME4